MDIAFHFGASEHRQIPHHCGPRKPPQSVVQALVEKDGIDIMKDIEKALREAMKGPLRPTRSPQRRLCVLLLQHQALGVSHAAAGIDPPPGRLPAQADTGVQPTGGRAVSRSIDKLDLHYIATVTMAQGLMAPCSTPHHVVHQGADVPLLRRNRTQHTPKGIKQVCFHKVETEMQMQVEKSIMASSRELRWEKEHLGALYLTESVTSGYAYWSFEEEYNKPPKPPPEPPQGGPDCC